MWKMRYEMANKTGKGGHWVECKNQGCLEPDVMAYLEGPEVVKDAKMTYVKKGRKCRRITKKKGIQEMAKVPKDYPKWEFKIWPKSRLITRNGKTRNGQSAD